MFFYFDVGTEPTYICFEAWADTTESDVDIYLRAVQKQDQQDLSTFTTKQQLSEYVNYKTCQWKANQYGRKRIDIYEGTFAPNSRFFVNAEPYRSGMNTFKIKMESRLAKPVHMLTDGEPLTLQLAGGNSYATYKIKNAKRGHYLLLEVSRKKAVQTFVSSSRRYPDGDVNYRWAFGDLSGKFATNLKREPSMRDILQTMMPYKIQFPSEK